MHMVPNSLRYASRKHWSPITKAMRDIYTSATVEAAEQRFESFAADSQDTLPRHDPLVAAVMGRVRAVRGVPRRAAQSRLHHGCNCQVLVWGRWGCQ
ncbi:transposase [Candidatus Poriferisodalis sp.]|uniref:transposase n=1 Tax=Candidatus Poriferisodalis sp. TaxID=3101277 RepID=UPI003B01C3EE